MTKEKILNILKTIQYPGFSRDIVSFGMVKTISIENDIINVSLSINTDNQENLKKVESEIIKKLKNNKVSINFEKPEKQTNINQENVKQNIPQIKQIIAIASGKGGVGKSTIALNLATTLSKTNKVGILDLDIYGPSLPKLVNVNTQPQMTNEKKLIPINKFNMKLMSFGFINTQNSPTIWRGPMVARMTQQFFDDVEWGELDYLILDLPPGTGDIQLTLVQKLAISGAIIITTPQELALLDVRKGADMFKKVNTPVLGVIENMTHFLCPHCNKETQIFPGKGGEEESARLNVPLLGKIFLNPDIAISAENGVPYVLNYENSVITSEYDKMAQQISSILNNNFSYKS